MIRKIIPLVIKKNFSKYISLANDSFDIFIIDGKYQKECLDYIVKLKTGVMIILDNADWYPNAVGFLQDKLQWIQIDFHGFGPINNYTWTTSLFINPRRHTELRYCSALKSKCFKEAKADDMDY